MNRFRSLLLCVVLSATGGCADFPDMGTVPKSSAIAPDLLPLDVVMAGIALPRATPAVATALAGRAARLRTRASLMRGPVMDPTTRARLNAAIAAGRA